MKTNKISESGIIGADGKLRMPMDRLNAYFAQHKGQRVVVRFEAAEHGSSELQRAYYYNYIVPTIQTALYDTGERKNEKQVDKWLQEQCPEIFETYYPGTTGEEIQLDSDGTVYRKKVDIIGYTETKGIRDLTVSEMSDFLEWLKQFAAENLSVYIEDPRTL